MKEKIIHTTKYDVGDAVYWLEVNNGIYEIEHTKIKSINIGAKIHHRYEVSYTTRAEFDLFDTFEEAKKGAINRQIERNGRTLEIIKEYKDIKVSQF